MYQQRYNYNKRIYLTTNSKQNVEHNNGGQDHYDNFGVVIPDCRPESHHQDWAGEAESHHDGAPPQPFIRKNP